jgi:hypothetical membrane protein
VRGHPQIRRLSLFGVAAPLMFFLGVILVSWAERDFMAELGWHQWPSGTALGPRGWITVLTFLVTGLCQIAFGAALFVEADGTRRRQIGPALLVLSGLGMAFLAFTTDPDGAEATWHGRMHVVAYFTFFFALLLAYVFLVWNSWQRLGRSTWKYAPIALVPWLGALVLPDGLAAGNYMFFAILFTPLLVLALRMSAPAKRLDAVPVPRSA